MTYFIGAYWGERKETRLNCATRISTFLQMIANQDVLLSKWFKKGASKKISTVALPHNAEDLQDYLRSNQKDVGFDEIPELGFNFSAWTGKDTSMMASISSTCGASSHNVRNHIVVSFSNQREPELEFLKSILRKAVEVFEPEDAVVSTAEILVANPSMTAWEAPAIFRYKCGTGYSAPSK